jgi:integrase
MALPMERAIAARRRPVQEVSVFGLQRRSTGERNKRPWIVRWAIQGRQRSRAFRTRAEGERFRSMLFAAIQRGEWFDDHSGGPLSWLPSDGDTKVHLWVRRWLAEQWAEWAPRTRTSAIEALVRFVSLAVSAQATDPPNELRSYLRSALRPDREVEDGECDRWLDAWSVPLSDLTRAFLALVDAELGLGADGQTLAASTAVRFRTVAKSCIRRAVELEVISSDPWPPASRGRSQRKSVKPKRSIDARTLPDPATMARAIEAMRSHQPASRTFQLMTAVAYYAGLRPSEVMMLRGRALHLPRSGWGRIDVVEADVDFDEPGEPKTGPRAVPIPPNLVAVLQAWIEEREIAPNALLFRTRNDGRPAASNWARSWQRALRLIGHPPLRVYDCRHAAATTWLMAGVPLGEFARRLGHSVETLVTTYAGVLAGDEALANKRIDDALSTTGAHRD